MQVSAQCQAGHALPNIFQNLLKAYSNPTAITKGSTTASHRSFLTFSNTSTHNIPETPYINVGITLPRTGMGN
jgi:hypothetical protein